MRSFILPLVLGLSLIAAILCAPYSSAQSSAPEFDVASVKSMPDSAAWVAPQVSDPQRFRTVNVLHRIIEWAYSVRDFQILGSGTAGGLASGVDPGAATLEWLWHERFEIQGTTERPSSEKQMHQMVQRLLAERFKLKLHHESRALSVYELVVSKSGLKLRIAAGSQCNSDHGNVGVGHGILSVNCGTMSDLVNVLNDNLDRPVLDKTNLTGRYSYSLTFDVTEPVAGQNWTPIGSAIFTPIQSLGLTLQPQKAPVEMLVIDHVEKPAAN